MKPDLGTRLDKLRAKIRLVEKRLRRLSSLRLLSFFSIPVSIAAFYASRIDILFSLAGIFPFIAIFYFIVYRYIQFENYKKRLVSMEIAWDREWLRDQKETKKLFRSIPVADEIRKSHPFSEDLNLFEKDGLFPLLDTTSTSEGERLFLENFLRKKPESEEEILERQKTIKKLSENPWFSFKFIRIGSESWEFFLGKKWETRGWKKPGTDFFRNRKILRAIFPVYSIVSGLLISSSLLIQVPFGSALFFLNLILFILYRRDSLKEYKILEEAGSRQKETFRLVLHLFRGLEIAGIETNASKDQLAQAFREFQKAFSRLHSAPLLHFLANSLYLHDLWFIKRIESWRKAYQDLVVEWIGKLERIDSYMPLIHLRFTNPEWVYPTISTDTKSIKGEDLAHPLLPHSSAVPNPIYELKKGEILLITGSNMAGKTTYMRTVGSNVLLGLCGGVVHGKSLEFPPLEILCSVKNQDSLTEGISLFYAEAKRLAEIFQTIQKGESAFLILLDEILKGTNTKERFIASKEILNRLQGKNAFTLCTTHDLELAEIPHLQLKHFTEKIQNDNMSFDYKIRDGVVQTTNAVFILKKEGVIG